MGLDFGLEAVLRHNSESEACLLDVEDLKCLDEHFKALHQREQKANPESSDDETPLLTECARHLTIDRNDDSWTHDKEGWRWLKPSLDWTIFRNITRQYHKGPKTLFNLCVTTLKDTNPHIFTDPVLQERLAFQLRPPCTACNHIANNYFTQLASHAKDGCDRSITDTSPNPWQQFLNHCYRQFFYNAFPGKNYVEQKWLRNFSLAVEGIGEHKPSDILFRLFLPDWDEYGWTPQYALYEKEELRAVVKKWDDEIEPRLQKEGHPSGQIFAAEPYVKFARRWMESEKDVVVIADVC
ncbi:hypothetical protein HDV00_002160 [Rhizophlyctis rosea]|nr:hypothetical protein HDV00_002160 [Rhizophlyctis rosea]